MSETQSRGFVRGLSGSLAFRILLIETILLVIPLLFFAVVMYTQDARLKSRETLFTLERVQHEKEAMIREVMKSEEDFLAILHLLQPDQELLTQITSLEASSFLFHLKATQTGYVCDEASSPGLIGMNFSPQLPKHLSPEGHLVGSSERFYFFRPFSRGQEVWASGFSPKRLTDKLAIEKNIPDSTVVSLLTQEGQVLLSTAKSWEKWQLPEVLKKKDMFSFMGKQYIGVLSSIPRSNLMLLVAAPEHVTFVNIPFFFAKMITLLLAILVLGGGATIWLTIRLGRPLKKLCAVMERVKRADLQARYAPDRMGFEINVVGEIFNGMIDSLVDFVNRIKKEQAAKETFERELMIGQEVQTSILPKEVPSFPGLDIAARFVSAKEVGGDFYDFLVRPCEAEDRLFFSIADTAGKGIYACLYSLSVRSMLRSYGEIHDDLETIVRETNNLFCLDTGDTGVFVTAWVAFFDEKTRQLHYSNCGHFPALLLRSNGTLEKLTTQGMALGVEKFEAVQTGSVQVEKGDSLLLFTDGVVEAHNDQMEMFGEKRLVEAFLAKQALSAKELVDEIIEDVALFAEGSPQHDDLTILVMKCG